MRAITVRQPWAWAIIHGGKGVENRTRNLAGDYRGTVAIHAGLAPFEQDNMASRAHRAAHGSEIPTQLTFGAIIGIARLWAVHQATPGDLCCPRGSTNWGEPDVWHLCLTDPRPVDPIPCRGQLGLWTPPVGVLEQLAVITEKENHHA